MLIATTAALSAGLGAAWSAPPRYDGAGYAVLARALLEGRGYRAIDHPDAPRHAHFPPGYPLLLAVTWRITGISTAAARGVSIACVAGAAVLSWCWFRRMLPARAALALGLALAVNWLWARTGGAIQSEPLFLLLGQAAILAAARGTPAVVTGTLLAACLLTRQVAVGLALAVLIDLALRGRWRAAATVAATTAVLVAPWLIWMSRAADGGTQAGLLLRAAAAGLGPIAAQLLFYVRRIPDQITGPFVEVATVFGRSGMMAIAADLWAATATAVIALGWLRCLRRPRRRLAGLVPTVTLLVLVVWPFTEAGRFLIPLIPCLLVGATEGLAIATRQRWIAAAMVLAASLPYSAYALATGKARAAEASHRDFDAACAWLADRADRPGPVLTRHPGEVFWRTGRQALEVATSERPGDIDAGAEAIARAIDRYGVAYLLVDQERYANAPTGPLARFVAGSPGRVAHGLGRRGRRIVGGHLRGQASPFTGRR